MAKIILMILIATDTALGLMIARDLGLFNLRRD